MPLEETVNVVSGSTLSAVDTPVSAPSSSSSEELKSQLTKPESPLPKEPNGSQNKSPQQKLDTRSSDEIRKQLESEKRAGGTDQDKSQGQNGQENGSSEQAKQTEVEDKSKWFDPEKGFRTAEDMKKSYGELQASFTKKSEEVKQERSRLEQEQSQIKQEIEDIKKIQAQRPLTTEEMQKREAVNKWKEENKDALDLIKQTIKQDLDAEKSADEENKKVSLFNEQILKDRNDWLETFNKDEGRKKLWPVMEEIFREKGDNLDSTIKDFAKNPLPYMEAMAIQKNFSHIAEQIRAEAVVQYVAKQKEAAEVERKTKFALPGGPKTGTGDVDISKLSSAELGSLLPRNENG